MSSLHTYHSPALLIDGEWIPAGQRDGLEVTNPANGEKLGDVPVATLADIDAAVDAAQCAFGPWSQRTPLDRSGILRRIGDLVRTHIDRLSVILTMEQGKTLRESVGELNATADTFDWMAEEGKRAYGRIVPSRFAGMEQLVVYEPVG
ncbi:MAG: aldehyde dehydrogenase family protein, partial [Comamonadaceae bacterium]